jgi:hypothetical protein
VRRKVGNKTKNILLKLSLAGYSWEIKIKNQSSHIGWYTLRRGLFYSNILANNYFDLKKQSTTRGLACRNNKQVDAGMYSGQLRLIFWFATKHPTKLNV